MTVRLGILVEGPTEERFAKDLLAPHLDAFGVFATSVVIQTSRAANGMKRTGGGVSVERVMSELRRLLSGYSDGYVTTLLDLYGFQGRLDGETVAELEARISQRLESPRNLIPYVQRHEFEALLLADGEIVAEYFQAPAMATIVAKAIAAGTPEDVNDSPQTAPSKRLEAWTAEHAPVRRRYSKNTKTLHGPALAARLTLPVIRAACPRFALWLGRLERLAQRG